MDKIYSNQKVNISCECPECGEEISVEGTAELTIYEPDIDVEVTV